MRLSGYCLQGILDLGNTYYVRIAAAIVGATAQRLQNKARPSTEVSFPSARQDMLGRPLGLAEFWSLFSHEA